jgi:hypothetical protein
MVLSSRLEADHLLATLRGYNPSPASRLSMQEFLRMEAGKVYLSRLGEEIEGAKTALASVDLASEGGLTKGIALQNQVRGLNRALDILIEIANFEEERPDERHKSNGNSEQPGSLVEPSFNF